MAAQGYLTVIAPMLLNLAVFSENAANDVIASYPQVNSWAIGGHSLGGTIAAQFCYDNPGKIKGLV
ncbi:MAG TPA: alpha/beta hydrolase, partial [Candidatus Deferrimicrobium sp.]|nr:alpha/beta hydrolase [Candidatus Deferrimicrobium sp.]